MKHPPRNIDQSCFDWQKIILQKTDMPANAKYMALYLASYMNMNRDVAWPSQKTIERETGLAHATVLKWVDFLVSEGWLAKQSGNRVESNRYWISFPDEVGQSLTYVNQREKVGQPLTSNNNTNNKNNTIGAQLSENFTVTHDMVIWANDKGFAHIDLINETDRFIDYNKGKGNVGKDWTATWRNWIRNADKFGKERRSKTDGRAAIAEAIRGSR